MDWRSRLYSVRKCCFAVVAAWLSEAVEVRQLWKMNANGAGSPAPVRELSP